MNAENPSIQRSNQEERVLAALSHASVILPLWGVIASIVIWATQKDKSKFVALQSLQAVAYQFTSIIVFFLFGICYGCSLIIFPLFLAFTAQQADIRNVEVNPIGLLPMAFPFLLMAIGMLFWFVFVTYGFIGAFKHYRVKIFDMD